MSANLDERNVGGYSFAYRRDDTNFPVYITAALAAVFFTAAWITGAAYWLALAVTAAGFTYYNIPLLETGRPTIGANQYGITYENLAAEQNELLVFQPLITHSVTKTTAHFAFHVQMIADFLTVEEVGEKMLAELARNGNRNDASSCDCCIGAFCDERRGVG